MNQVTEQTVDTVMPIVTGQGFVGMVAQHSMTAEIGADLLGITKTDTVASIQSKIDKACRRHPEHLMEIMLAGLTAICFSADSKEETLESCMLAFGMADRAAAH